MFVWSVINIVIQFFVREILEKPSYFSLGYSSLYMVCILKVTKVVSESKNLEMLNVSSRHEQQE
jgi:hypothetical protein